ncbi:hypothetical protein GCM10027422_12070 [Hymenobacter arcticus]
MYNKMTVGLPPRPKQNEQKVQHYAHGTTQPAALGYPNLYDMYKYFFKYDSKTKLINPANVWHGDVVLLVAPFGTGLSESFHAPTISVRKEVIGPRLEFNFKYSVSLVDSTKIHLGIDKYFSIDKDVAPITGIVEVWGWVNTVTGEGDVDNKKATGFERMGVDH